MILQWLWRDNARISSMMPIPFLVLNVLIFERYVRGTEMGDISSRRELFI